MPSGGSGRGQGRKPRVLHYRRGKSVGVAAFNIVRRCEDLLREAYQTGKDEDKQQDRLAGRGLYETDAVPSVLHKQIVGQVAEEIGETDSMIERLLKEHRRLIADLKSDLKEQDDKKGMTSMNDTMPRAEREDLQRLVRQREKALLSAAKQRSAELLAEFENQMGSEYRFDADEVWEEAARVAKIEVEKAQTRVAVRCAELGIPKEFAPSLELQWHHRGYGNAVAERRNELRRMAQTRIEALEKKAITDIHLASVEAQTKLAVAGLTSQAARNFIDTMPSVESLMPVLSFEAVAGKSDPPVAERLTSPGALRQRRYRERHRNAQVTSRNGEKTAENKD
jgi:hypothetical protein